MRKEFLPFSRPTIDDDAVRDVTACLKSGWLTTGPKTIEFEKMFQQYTGAKYAVSVNSATAGLHLALLAFGIGKGDEVITTPMTFVATVNTIIFAGATPVLADIDAKTLNILPQNIER